MGKNKEKLKQGDTWTPIITFYDNGIAMDCTGYTSKLWIKASLEEPTEELFELTILWTDQDSGVGYFSFTHAQSITLPVGSYWYEIKLYESTSNTVVKTVIQDQLIVEEVLEKDL